VEEKEFRRRLEKVKGGKGIREEKMQ